MNESANAVHNPSPVMPAVPPARRLKWRERHKKFYQGLLPIFGFLVGMALGIGLFVLVMGPVAHSNKVGAPTVLGFAFIAAGIAWVGGFLGMILGYLVLIAEKLLADDSKSSHF